MYPGSFNPLTIAHVAIADAARLAHHLDRVRLTISKVALAKESLAIPSIEHRLAVLGRVADRLGWLDVALTEAQLIADIAEGADVVVMGGDKWAQVNDPVFYDDSPAARDAAVARLPTLAIAPRRGVSIPPQALLDVPPDLAEVSSTAIRNGDAASWMVAEAADFDDATGAWTEPERYERLYPPDPTPT